MAGEEGGPGANAKELLLDLIHWERVHEIVREFGYKKAVGIVAFALLLIVKLVAAPALVSELVRDAARKCGADLAVADWDFHLIGLEAVAKDVVLRVHGPYSRRELLQADRVELDLALSRAFSGWVERVRVEEPKIYLERQLSGHWNFQDLVDLETFETEIRPSPPPRAGGGAAPGASRRTSVGTDAVWASLALRGADQALRFDLDRLVVDDGELEWVENLQGFSGSGLLHNSQASLLLTRVHLDLQPVRGIADQRPYPTRFTLEARVGDGKVSAEGRANFFRWIPARARTPGPGAQSEGGTRATTADVEPAEGADTLVWSPAIDATLALNNFGAGAFAQVAPDAAITPTAGTMFGNVRVVLEEPKFDCQTDLTLTDVAFVVNRDSPVMAGRADRVSGELQGWRSNRRINVGCGGDLEKGRPHQVVQAAITRAAVADAPPDVRRIAAYEEARFTRYPVTDATVAALEREVAAKLGAPAADAVFEPDASGESPASHGLKKFGHKLKNVFTKNDDH